MSEFDKVEKAIKAEITRRKNLCGFVHGRGQIPGFDHAIDVLFRKINDSLVNPDAALKFSQAALNLAHAQQVIKITERQIN